MPNSRQSRLIVETNASPLLLVPLLLVSYFFGQLGNPNTGRLRREDIDMGSCAPLGHREGAVSAASKFALHKPTKTLEYGLVVTFHPA